MWDCKYHWVGTTKYRYPVLGGDRGVRGWEWLREIARSQERRIYAGSVNRDHEPMLLGIPPQISVSRAVQYWKGKSSHKLLSEWGALRQRYRGRHLWARGYWVGTSGNVADEVWKRYLEEQTPPEPDADFHGVSSAARLDQRQPSFLIDPSATCVGSFSSHGVSPGISRIPRWTAAPRPGCRNPGCS